MNDNDGGDRQDIAKWWSASNFFWNDPSLSGTAQLKRSRNSAAPVVTITSPEDGAVYLEGTPIDRQV